MQTLTAPDVPRPTPLSSPAAPVPPVFRNLALATFLLTLLLILVGGVVRLSDSGLGCGPAGAGLHGWPFCDGGVIPALETNMLIEYTHRALASAVGLLLIVLTAVAWRRLPERRTIVVLASITLAIVIGEGLLGGLTVEHGLHPWLVAIHLGVSMVIAALLLALWSESRDHAGDPPDGDQAVRASLAERTLGVVAPLMTWGTIFVGGYVAGTQLYGTPGYEYSVGAHMACGDQFPTCLGGWWPWGMSELVDAQLAHRLLMYLAAVSVTALVVFVLRRGAGPATRKLAVLSFVALVTQILLGAANVWFGEHRGMILAHLSLGTALWLLVFSLVWSTQWQGSARRQQRRGP